MLILEINNLKKYFNDRLIVSVDNLTISSGDKIGVVGRNGAGKTTFLNILAGEESCEGIVKRNCSISYIRQFPRENIKAHGKILSEFGIGRKAGIDDLSGGEYTKLNIAAALSGEGELLLADEPTCNLDYEGISLLQKKLEKIETFVLISHDRELMDSLCSRIIEIEDGKLALYEGNYSSYKRQKTLEMQFRQKKYEHYISEKSRLQRTIEQTEKSSKSMRKAPRRMGNSEARLHKGSTSEKRKKISNSVRRMKVHLKNLQVEKKPYKVPGVKFDFSLVNPPENKIVISGKNICFNYGSVNVLKDADFEIYNGSKTAIVGSNGSGKTTLMNLMEGDSKSVYKVPKAVIGYLCQDFSNLDSEKTVIDNVMRDSVQDEISVRTVLARLLFTGSDVYKKVSVLSGGEKIKASFAKIFVSDANILLLDEPTNYLDLQSVESLEDILESYLGTVVFVSHDRKFINSIADRMMLLKDGKITEFGGNLREFERHQKLKKDSEGHRVEKSVLQMKLTEIISRMLLPGSDKEMLEVEYKDVLNRLKNLDKK
ncbi:MULTISPECIES: ribosomal protection-like ABC-F family protein [Clostridium]|uniref:Ribosomal protection-like ABC-F family protein n=1 Tax=Clostridium lapidicellarium TaxID=3240931 RepID=A0ABV4DS08_9CLOT|nr:ABC-F type ribosomal protection protein [uncultured Clostridium sp.]